MRAAIRTEWWKLRRSPVTLVATALIGVVIPAMGLGFQAVASGGGSGPLARKAGAMLVGDGWFGYLGAIEQIAAAAAFLGAGVVVTWVFGREHVDRTFSSLFALATPRRAIAGAKFVVLTCWLVSLSMLMTAVAAGLGLLAGVGPFHPGTVTPELARLFAVVLASTVLALPVGWIASVGRGYLPAVGALVLVIAAAQVSVLFGMGAWFPFAVPGLLAVAGSAGIPVPNAVQFALVPATALLGVLLTVRWWHRAEVA